MENCIRMFCVIISILHTGMLPGHLANMLLFFKGNGLYGNGLYRESNLNCIDIWTHLFKGSCLTC